MPLEGLVFEIQGDAKIRRLTSLGTYIADGVGFLHSTLSENTKCLVYSAMMRLNDQVLFNDTDLTQYFSYVDQVRPDENDEESLSFYCKFDDVTLTSQSYNDMNIAELNAEALQRLKMLGGTAVGTEETRSDKIIFYSARDHFLLPQNEIPAVISDKCEMKFILSSENLTCSSDRLNTDSSDCFYELSEIDFYIYSFALSDLQTQAFIDT